MLINATIQVIPLTNISEAFLEIDKAILMIQNSGLNYSVGAFETTIEGEYEAVQALLKKVQDFCYAQSQFQFLVYTKLHICGSQNILVADKTKNNKL